MENFGDIGYRVLNLLFYEAVYQAKSILCAMRYSQFESFGVRNGATSPSIRILSTEFLAFRLQTAKNIKEVFPKKRNDATLSMDFDQRSQTAVN